MRTYAVVTDVTASRADAEPDKVKDQIRQASVMVERATVKARYDVTPAGYPTDPEIIEAFQLSVVAQVKFWLDNDLDPGVGVTGQAPLVASQSADGASASYTFNRSAEQVEEALKSLCQASVDILWAAGFQPSDPVFIW